MEKVLTRNRELLKAFSNEQDRLLEKMSRALENGDYGSYKNLVNSLTSITTLVQNEEAILDKKKEFNEQNKSQERPCEKMHIKWNGQNEYKKGFYNVEVNFKNEMHTITGGYKSISEYILKLCKNNNVIVYTDDTTFGHVLLDILYDKGLKVSPTTKIFAKENDAGLITDKDIIVRWIEHIEYKEVINKN